MLATCPVSLPGSVVSGVNLQLVRNTNAVAFAGCVMNQFDLNLVVILFVSQNELLISVGSECS